MNEELEQSGSTDRRDRVLSGLIAGEYAISCERCQYDLRGLAGEVKICPECGTHNSLTPETVTEMDICHEYDYLRKQARRFSTTVVVGVIVVALGLMVAAPLLFMESAWFILVPISFLVVWVLLSEQIKLLKEELGHDQFYDVLYCLGPVRLGSYIILLLLLSLCGFTIYLNMSDRDGFPRFTAWVTIPVILLCVVYGWKRLVSPRKRMDSETLDTLLWERSKERAMRQKWKRIRLRIEWSTVPEEMDRHD